MVPVVLVLVPVLVVVLGFAVLVLAAGLRAAAVALVVPAVVLLSPGLAGLDMRVLVRREEVVETVDFFSSSLALTLGRLRWLEVEVAVVGRRDVVVVVGRVGGLLRAPVVREVVVGPAVLDAMVEVVPGRRTVLVVVVPGRRVVVVVVEVLASPLDFGAGASGAASGVGSGAAETSGEDGAGVSSFS